MDDMNAPHGAMDLDFSGDALLMNELLLSFSSFDTGGFAYQIPQSERFKELPPNQDVEEEIELVEDVDDDFYGTSNSASSALQESQTEVSPEPPIQAPIPRRYVFPMIKSKLSSEPAATRIQGSLPQTNMDEEVTGNASTVAKASCEYCLWVLVAHS
jgi:hypothetical protein